MSTPAVIQFSSSVAAAGLVAGLPAAARAVREAALAGIDDCWLDVNGSEPLSASVQQEIFRLAGAMQVYGLDGARFDAAALPAYTEAMAVRPMPAYAYAQGARASFDRQVGTAPAPLLLIAGEALVDAATIRAAVASGTTLNPALSFATPDELAVREPRPSIDAAAIAARYAAAGRAIITATAKSTDGLVSRSLNRPISQAISRVLLRNSNIRPIHATMGTAAIGVLMFATLVSFGSPVGLIIGAILFHAASVFDGVDGEIARATFRTSDRGAMIDSLVDAAINLSFIAGIVINLAQRGRWGSAMFGIAGLAMLAIGLTTLGTRARRLGAPIGFDGLKGRFRDNGSRWGKWVVWLTMRDFLALASVVLVIAGLTDEAIMAFSGIMTVWLVVVLTTHARQSALGS